MTYSAEVLADSPLLYWRLGESSGTTATDASGNGRHGTYAGSPTLGATGLVDDADTAATFDGVDDAVTYADTTNLTAFTAEAWFKHDVRPDSSGALFGRSTDAGTIFYVYVNYNGTLVAGVYNSTGGYAEISYTTPDVCDGVAHHVALTFDAPTLTLYLDGAESGTTTRSGTLPTTDIPFEVGASTYTTLSQFLAGTIDEVAYYDTALSSSRIAAHYDAGTGGGATTGTFDAALPAIDLAGALTGLADPEPPLDPVDTSTPTLDVRDRLVPLPITAVVVTGL